MASLEIISRYEAPFRAAGMNPGLITTSSLAALELAPEAGLSVLAKLSGRVLTALVRDKNTLKFARCVEMPSSEFEDIAAVLAPTLVYVEDNFGRRAEHLQVCGWEGGRALRGRVCECRWNSCGRHWARRGRITRGCWDICAASPRIINLMKIPINLASQPFRRDRPMVAASIAAIAALTSLLGALVVVHSAGSRSTGGDAPGHRATEPADSRRIHRAGAA